MNKQSVKMCVFGVVAVDVTMNEYEATKMIDVGSKCSFGSRFFPFLAFQESKIGVFTYKVSY